MLGEKVTAFTICAAGYRGAETLLRLAGSGISPARIVAYPQKQDSTKAFETLQEFANLKQIQFERSTTPIFEKEEWVFFIGWQFLVRKPTGRTIVIHDSLLPRYRGFAPTATALINGEHEIGVTAFLPSAAVDGGPVLGQRKIAISYPLKIKAALDLQIDLTASLIADLVQMIDGNSLTAVAQDESAATYSLWRDEEDYYVDWKRSAAEICRTIDALGDPFSGARTRLNGDTIIIDDAQTIPDLQFERRDIGKIWSLEADGPIVVCGTGCLQITAARDMAGNALVFEKLRSRLT